MAKKSTPNKAKQLLNVIGRQDVAPSASPPPEATTPAATPARTAEKSNSGEATVLWFHPEDKQRIRELVAYLASQGVPRLNNSLVIKTALRAVQMNEDLLAAYHQAVQSDRRLKKYKAQ
jgi:hypothetical protein